MKKLIVSLLLFSALSLHAKPFRRALVLAGGGLSIPSYASIAQHMEAYGWKPDVIISTCGSTIGTTTYRSANNYNRHHELLLSQEFHNVLQAPSINIKNALSLKKILNPLSERLNRLQFTDFIFDVPLGLSFNGALDKFPESGTRLIMIAGKGLFPPLGNYEKLRYRYQETYFTDPGTAEMLRGRHSDIHRAYPDSKIAPEIDVQSDVSPMEASRASISDPLLINPGRIGKEFYLTGGVNLYPYELASEIADEVYMTYPLIFEDFMDDIVENTFGYTPSIRQEQVVEKAKVNWIDVFGKNKSFSPKINIFLHLKEGVPKNHASYKKIVEKEWEFGKVRAYEAIQARKSHIREGHLRKVLSEQKKGKTEEDYSRPKRKPFRRH